MRTKALSVLFSTPSDDERIETARIAVCPRCDWVVSHSSLTCSVCGQTFHCGCVLLKDLPDELTCCDAQYICGFNGCANGKASLRFPAVDFDGSTYLAPCDKNYEKALVSNLPHFSASNFFPLHLPLIEICEAQPDTVEADHISGAEIMATISSSSLDLPIAESGPRSPDSDVSPPSPIISVGRCASIPIAAVVAPQPPLTPNREVCPCNRELDEEFVACDSDSCRQWYHICCVLEGNWTAAELNKLIFECGINGCSGKGDVFKIRGKELIGLHARIKHPTEKRAPSEHTISKPPQACSAAAKESEDAATASAAVTGLPSHKICGRNLVNLGNTCYADGAIQAIAVVSDCVDELRKHAVLHESNDDCLACLTSKELQDILVVDTAGPVKPSLRQDHLKRVMQEQLDLFQQQDCTEFLDKLLQACQKDIKETSRTTRRSSRALSGCLTSLWNSLVQCCDCGSVSPPREAAEICMRLPIDGNSLEELFHNYVAVEEVQDVDCDKCLRKTRKTKRWVLEAPSKYLAVSLKRFDRPDHKDTKACSYPETLILPYGDIPTNRVAYELLSVVVHTGERDSSGHYVTYRKHDCSEWACYDDTIKEPPRKVPIIEVLSKTSEAYVLIYRKRNEATLRSATRASESIDRIQIDEGTGSVDGVSQLQFDLDDSFDDTPFSVKNSKKKRRRIVTACRRKKSKPDRADEPDDIVTTIANTTVGAHHSEVCWTLHIPDAEATLGSDTYAIDTLPRELRIVKSILGCGHGVEAATLIKKDTIFGPYVGTESTSSNLDPNSKEPAHEWEVRKTDGSIKFVDGKDVKVSNYLRFINCSENEENANLEAWNLDDEIFYISKRDIKADEELCVYYFLNDETAEIEGFTGSSKPIAAANGMLEFVCERCQRGYASQEQLHKHIELAHASSEKRVYLCPHCKRALGSKSAVYVHVLTQHQQKFVCFRCRASFATQNEQFAHEADVHGPPTCSRCNRKFLSYNRLRNHEHWSHGLKFPVSCELCKLTFKSNNAWLVHQRMVHIKPYGCSRCDYRAGVKQQVFLHIQARHLTSTEKRQCSQCPAVLKSAKSLKNHVADIHKRYVCKAVGCNQEFIGFNALRGHRNREHREELFCHVEGCVYSTPVRRDFNKHLKLHTKKGKVRKVRRSFAAKIRCCECSFRASDKRKVLDHVVHKHDAAAVEKFKKNHEIHEYCCVQSGCIFTSTSRRGYLDHMSEKHRIKASDVAIDTVPPSRRRCEECVDNDTMYTDEEFDLHYKLVH